jgi:hypothetical protein
MVGLSPQTEHLADFGGFLMLIKEQFSESYINSRSFIVVPKPVKTFNASTDCNIPIRPGTGPKTPLSEQLLQPSVAFGLG